MTTGTRVDDYRYSYNGDCGISRIGMYSSKTWVGNDMLPPFVHENSYQVSHNHFYDPLIHFYDILHPNVVYSGSYSSCFGGVSKDHPWSDNDQLRLLNKLADNVRGHSFDASIFAGESREALEMISSRARSVFDSLRALKKGDLSSFCRALRVQKRSNRSNVHPKDLNKVWLEYEFGWRPLANDLHDAAHAVFALTNRPVTKTYRSRHRVDGSVVTAAGAIPIPADCFTSRVLRLKLVEDYSPLSSLGLTDPKNVAWELLPYSFVADWVIPIGTYLKVRSFLSDIGPYECWQSTYRYMRVSTLKSFNPNTVILSTYPYFAKTVEVERSSIQLVAPRPKIKDFSKILSWRHALDSVSLLVNRFGSRPFF